MTANAETVDTDIPEPASYAEIATSKTTTKTRSKRIHQHFRSPKTATAYLDLEEDNHDLLTHDNIIEQLYQHNACLITDQIITTVQIATSRKYINITFTDRTTMLANTPLELNIHHDKTITFKPRTPDTTQVSLENLPLDLPDTFIFEMLEEFGEVSRKPSYKPTTLYHNTKIFTGTRIITMNQLTKHIPRTIKCFGFLVRVRYDGQPNTTYPPNYSAVNVPTRKNHQHADTTTEQAAKPTPTEEDTEDTPPTQEPMPTANTTQPPTRITQTPAPTVAQKTPKTYDPETDETTAITAKRRKTAPTTPTETTSHNFNAKALLEQFTRKQLHVCSTNETIFRNKLLISLYHYTKDEAQKHFAGKILGLEKTWYEQELSDHVGDSNINPDTIAAYLQAAITTDTTKEFETFYLPQLKEGRQIRPTNYALFQFGLA